jgi:hypothetical protein
MKPLDLPAPISAYFTADQEGPAAVARCFATDAVVTDESRRHVGRDAIQQWKAAASTAFRYTTQPVAVEGFDGQHVVTGRVSGDFPGSPIDLRYHFRLAAGLIAALEITR